LTPFLFSALKHCADRIDTIGDKHGRMRSFVELTAPEVNDLSPEAVAVVPVGAIEQHGPHLPLITDLLIAESVARDAVADYGEAYDLWLLPSLAFSRSAGSLMPLADDVGRRLASTPLLKLVLLNAHGSDSALLEVCARELQLAYGLCPFIVHTSVPGSGVHGGRDETAVVLHLRPDLVDLALARRDVPQQAARYKEIRFGPTVAFGWLSEDAGPDGDPGDPTLASADLGRKLYGEMLTGVGEALLEVSAFASPLPH
jgi:creatinine amidohydrolase